MAAPPPAGEPHARSAQAECAVLTDAQLKERVAKHLEAGTLRSDAPPPPVMTREALRAMLASIAPNEAFEEDAEALLCTLASELAGTFVDGAADLAAHRGATGSVDARDVDLYLKRCHGITMPGFGGEELRPYKRPVVLEEHRARLASTRRAQESAPALPP